MPLDSAKVETAAMPVEPAIKSETERPGASTNLKSRKDDFVNELGISNVLFDSLTVRLRKHIQS